MPLWILANWKLIVGAVVAAVLGGLLLAARLEIASLKTDAAKTALDIANQNTEAANILAASEKRNAELIAANLALNTQIEKDHADAEVKLAAIEGDNRKLSDNIGRMLRATPAGGPCGGDHVPGTSSAAGSGSSGASSSGLLSAVADIIDEATGLFAEADGAAETGLRCHAFAVGRH